MTKKIKAVIFDMGGVIIRTTDQSSREELANKFNMSVSELADLVFNSPTSIAAEKGEITPEAHWQKVHEYLGIEFGNWHDFINKFFHNDEEDQDLIKLFRKLRGKYKLGLLSNAYVGTKKWAGEKHTFLNYFDAIFFSADHGMRKPDPAFFQLVLDALEVEPQEAIFIDDFKVNIESAKKIGLHTVWYNDKVVALAQLDHILQTFS